LTALEKEIRVCGKRLQGQRLTSVYVGGGTPTTLSPQQLDELFSVLRESFNLSEALEITVEAGRPDSITKEKLLALKRAGVDRISVNPQTMQEDTLRRIGRKHSVAQVREVFLMARECGFDNINMDLIVGLPEETVEDFADTLRQVELLDPDSITIHSLVIKRASKLREILDAEAAMPEKERAVEMEKMMELGRAFAKKHGYAPYYMYRQKNSAGYAGSTGQENIGFAREGKECLYNILIMEEMQSILAVGAGASTKCYDRQSQLVSRVENVKSVTDYINRIDEMLERKRVSQWKQII
jgi:oxygen-independent coproporphyrinogen-3 oxidase